MNLDENAVTDAHASVSYAERKASQRPSTVP
jgi:hypothetical protein